MLLVHNVRDAHRSRARDTCATVLQLEHERTTKDVPMHKNLPSLLAFIDKLDTCGKVLLQIFVINIHCMNHQILKILSIIYLIFYH